MSHSLCQRQAAGILCASLLLLVASPAWAQRAPEGWIQDQSWLLLGPLGNPSGCSPAPATMLDNWIAPLDIATITPLVGQEPEIDFAAAASTDWRGIGDTPVWIALEDYGISGGNLVNLLNIMPTLGALSGEAIPNTDVMVVMVTYADYTGAEPLIVNVCDSSDDSIQVWVNNQLVHNVPLCSGSTVYCRDRGRALLLPGRNAIKVLMWQGGGDWNFRLRLERIDGTVVTDDDPEISYGYDGRNALTPPGAVVTRSALGQPQDCSRYSDALVSLKGSGEGPASVTLTEVITGPFDVVDVTNGGTFTPAPPATKNPVGIFEDARDVGFPCYKGATVLNGDGTYTVTGGGNDIWRMDDEFHFAYREATGDFDMTAKVINRVWAPGSRWGKVGIMAREDLTTRSRYAMLQTHGEDPQDADRFAGRAVPGGLDNFEVTPLAGGEHRDWMRIERLGDVFSCYMSLDGSNWQLFYAMDWGPGAPKTVLLGLAVTPQSTAQGGCVPAEITYDEVQILGGDDPKDPPAPAGGTVVWNNLSRTDLNAGVSYKLRGSGKARFYGDDGIHAITGDQIANVAPPPGNLGIFTVAHDIGSPLPCTAGETVYNSTDESYTVTGSGLDIWQEFGDQFQFCYREVEGDFSLSAHVKERIWAPGSRWGKVGIMARQDCTYRARYAMMQTHGEDPQDADRFAGRPTHGGSDNFEVVPAAGGPLHWDWMRLDRVGNQFTGFFSEDGVTWSRVHNMNWGSSAPSTVLLGLAVNGHHNPTGGCYPATIVFDEVDFSIPSYTLTRSLEGGDCPSGASSEKVIIKGQGDPGINVAITEEIRGAVTVSNIVDSGPLARAKFTPFAEPSPPKPVGIFTDSADIGEPCTAGSAVLNGDGSYSVTGGGNDIWQTGDQFQFAYRKATGDFNMVAHVKDRIWAPATRWGKVGIMARENHSARSRYAMVQTHGLDPQDADRFAARRTHEGNDNFEATPLLAAEHRDWMRLERVGNIFTGYMSLDGATWQPFFSMDWGVDAPRTVLLGLAVNGHADAQGGCPTATITYDEVEITGGEGPHDPLTPQGGIITWPNTPRTFLDTTGASYVLSGRGLVRVSGTALDRPINGPTEIYIANVGTSVGEFEKAYDIGVPCIPGETEYAPADRTYTLTTSGRDIWQGGDQFQFAYKTVKGDFSMVAHVREYQWGPGSRWGKVGIMARQDCTTTSRYAMIQVHGEDPQDADRFAGRPTHGGADNYEQTPLVAGEHRDWMRLDRTGNVFSTYMSLDGTEWQRFWDMDWGPDAPESVLLGLAGSAHPDPGSDCVQTTLVFDNVKITLPGEETLFRRGDADAKGGVPNITDGIYVLNYLFLGGPAPPCLESADADNKGGINITDGIYILNYLFQGGPAPPDPGPDACGPDTDSPGSAGDLGCASYPSC